ncbi:putative integral membrane protein [Immersiella caudata]|uniref:Integral membrane protein n=1 Tax=Immersiella caudata TaxID=314043 RepID=A0AA39U3W6_9PEZI|nr:putative integral membrane protein [Immersiella caudata]
MAPSPLYLAAHAFATIFIGFGINAILNPTNALTFFEWAPPSSPSDAQLVNSLLAVYGVRDIFMGLAIYASAWCGTKKSLGWTLIAASAVAAADGYVCYGYGKGEWNHWGYAPVITVVGGLLAL